VTADVLVDCEGSFATVGEAFPAVQSDERWWLPINCVLLRVGGLTLLIDTGVGPQPRAFLPDADARLLDELAGLGVTPAEIDVVVHTHLHVDHVGWDGAFPNARYLVHEDDWAFFMREPSLSARPHLRDKVLPLRTVELVSGDHELAPGVELFPTAGHTPGHMSVRAGSLVVLGDVVVHPLQVSNPDVVYVSDHDAMLAAATRRRVLGALADEGARVIAGHFRGAGRFERAGKGFRWAVE
jgi:glyoxylase-like metal-dependent hydrolase (beta-lactamase superfamily II)